MEGIINKSKTELDNWYTKTLITITDFIMPVSQNVWDLAKTRFCPIGPIRRVVIFSHWLFSKYFCVTIFFILLQIVTPITDKNISSHFCPIGPFGPIGPNPTFLILNFFPQQFWPNMNMGVHIYAQNLNGNLNFFSELNYLFWFRKYFKFKVAIQSW